MRPNGNSASSSATIHELVRHGIRGILRAHSGWKVVGEARDGSEAVQMARTLRPDLVVLDVTMPNVDGLEATKQILEACPDTKVLVLTMHESDQMVRRVLENGAHGYVLKSDLAAQLVKAIEHLAEGNRFLTPRVSEIVLQAFLKAEAESKRRERPEARPTSREVEIIGLLARGKNNKEVASALGITVRTVETHRAKIMLKLGLHSITELIYYANQSGIATIRERAASA